MTTEHSSSEPFEQPATERSAPASAIVWNLARIVIIALIVAATVDQIRLATVAAATVGVSETVAVSRLFSFFTVQSNVLTAIVLGWATIRAFTTRYRPESAALAVSLAAVTTYMLVTGLVYNIVLRSVGDVGIMLGWSNNIHHVVAPAFMALELCFAPGRRPVRWRSIAVVLAYPLAWVACTLLRGPHLIAPSTGTTPWYPYPFLDPTTTTGGYTGVAAWVAGISIVIAAVAALVILIRQRRARRASRSA